MTIPVDVEEKPIHNRAALNYLFTKRSDRPKLVFVPTIGSCERVTFSERIDHVLKGISFITIPVGALAVAAGIVGKLMNAVGDVDPEKVQHVSYILNTFLAGGGISLLIGGASAAGYGLKHSHERNSNDVAEPDNGRLAEAIKNGDSTSFFAKTFLMCFNAEGCSDVFKKRLIEKLSHHRDGMIRDIKNHDRFGYSEREGLGELADFLLETRDGYQRGASPEFKDSGLMNMFASNAKRLVKENEGKPKKIDSLQLLNGVIQQYQSRNVTDSRER